MAITLTNLAAEGAAASATAYSTASISPTPGALVLASVVSFETASTNVGDPTVTGLGLDWTLVGKVPYDAAGGDRASIWIFAGTGTASPGSVTFTVPAVVYGADMIVDEAVGAGSVPQAVTAVGSGGTSLSATLAAFTDPESVGYATFGIEAASTTFTPGTGWAALGDAQDSNYALAFSETGPTVDVSASFTGTVYQTGLVALELAPPAQGGTPGGSAAGGFTFTGAASGSTAHSGAAAGGFTVTGAASGTAGHSGAAEGSFAFTGTASGTAPTVGTASGAASGAHTWTGQATGTTRRSGVATGTYTWIGTARGGSSTPARDLTITAIGGPASAVSATGPTRRPISVPEPVLTATAAQPGLRPATTEPSL